MALTGNGSTGWQASGIGHQVADSPAYSYLFWIKITSATADFVPFGWTGSAGFTRVHWINASAQWWNWDSDNVGANSIPSLAGTAAPVPWTPVIVTNRSQSYRALFYSSNGNNATDTSAISTQTFTDVIVGNDVSTSRPMPSTAQVAECAIWMTELGSIEIARLMAGANPLTVKPDTLVCYFPLRSDLCDYGPRGTSLSCLGTSAVVFSDHPPVDDIPTWDIYAGPFAYFLSTRPRSRAFLTR